MSIPMVGFCCCYRRSYKSAEVLLDLVNSLRKKDKMLETPRILNLSFNSFKKINNAEARIFNPIYHMTLKFLRENVS